MKIGTTWTVKPTGEYREELEAEAEEQGICWVCRHEDHGDEVCCVLVRAGAGERACGCIE